MIAPIAPRERRGSGIRSDAADLGHHDLKVALVINPIRRLGGYWPPDQPIEQLPHGPLLTRFGLPDERLGDGPHVVIGH